MSEYIQYTHFEIERAINHTEITPYKHYSVISPKYGLNILKIRGNGLCFINSLVNSILGECWKNPTKLNNWLDNLYNTLFSYEFHSKFELYSRTIIYGATNLIDFLDKNNDLLFALSHNILLFAAIHYENLSELRTTQLMNCIDMSRDLTTFGAIDGNIRNFIMSILGVKSIYVISESDDLNHQRRSDVQNNVEQLIKDGYIGFKISCEKTINIGGFIGSIMLYTYNSSHYDAVFADDSTYLFENEIEILSIIYENNDRERRDEQSIKDAEFAEQLAREEQSIKDAEFAERLAREEEQKREQSIKDAELAERLAREEEHKREQSIKDAEFAERLAREEEQKREQLIADEELAKQLTNQY